MSERCEKCKNDMDFPSSREVLAKTRNCPSCGHTQRVEKSILYVVETLEEQVEWLSQRLYAVEAEHGIIARNKPLPVPPKSPVIAKTLPEIDLFAIDAPAFPVSTLKDLI